MIVKHLGFISFGKEFLNSEKISTWENFRFHFWNRSKGTQSFCILRHYVENIKNNVLDSGLIYRLIDYKNIAKM